MTWSDDERRIVPVYALTKGRTRSEGVDLPWETVVTTTEAGLATLGELRFEKERIVSMCRRPVSVAEVGAKLGVPVGVAQVLVSDLYNEGFLQIHRPSLSEDGRPTPDVLQRLIAGLRAQQA